MNGRQRAMLARIAATVAMLAALCLVPDGSLGRWARAAGYLVPYITIGHDILRKAARGILNRQVFDENFLMSIATIGALAIAIYDDGDYLEAVAVMLFYQIGELFQSAAIGRSRRSIGELMDIRPDVAHLEREGGVETVDPCEVEIGSVIVVRPGERVPIDGVVVSGASAIDTSALTGESAPRHASEGDTVLSGSVCINGALRIRTTKDLGESTASRILDLVEDASSRKSRPEALISRFARVYTPAVCAAALALATLPPSVRALLLGLPPEFGDWVYRALTFLVISCPCALVVSVPLTFFAGIGGASSQGVLVKGSDSLEALSRARCAVFDKTGTLTKGTFCVTGVDAISCSRDDVLEMAAYAESASSHPIAQSVMRAYGRDIDPSRVTDVREDGGMGVTAMVDGRRVAVGSARLMASVARSDVRDVKGTAVHVAIDGEYAGCISISDEVKPSSREAVASLKAAGVVRVVMLTGDSEETARSIAEEIGIDEHFSELLPEDKVACVERIMDEMERGSLIFVGDGINDAPVLSRADVGIAMGGIGSDAAIEAADVVLMDDDPLKAARAVRIARKCLRIVYQNIISATGVKFACLALGALGVANMWLAVFADVGVMVLAVLNAIRALFVSRV